VDRKKFILYLDCIKIRMEKVYSLYVNQELSFIIKDEVAYNTITKCTEVVKLRNVEE
jgi:hypothetical protein